MIFENIDRAFLWRDFDNVLARDNETVQGYLDVLDKAFHIDTPTRTSLNTKIQNVTTWTAIKNGTLSEPMMDLIARQLNFPAWEYVGKYNLIAPFDTVLKRKREMLKHIVRLMRVRGTPYAVEQILLAFGFTDVIIHENISVDILYDGTFSYNGQGVYAGTLIHQLFNVELTTTLDIATAPTPDEQLDAIVSIVNSFKKYRPELYQVIAHTPSFPGGMTRTIWEF